MTRNVILMTKIELADPTETAIASLCHRNIVLTYLGHFIPGTAASVPIANAHSSNRYVLERIVILKRDNNWGKYFMTYRNIKNN